MRVDTRLRVASGKLVAVRSYDALGDLLADGSAVAGRLVTLPLIRGAYSHERRVDQSGTAQQEHPMGGPDRLTSREPHALCARERRA
jgi:hypothetical protein